MAAALEAQRGGRLRDDALKVGHLFGIHAVIDGLEFPATCNFELGAVVPMPTLPFARIRILSTCPPALKIMLSVADSFVRKKAPALLFN
jgi:hypothetical protein